MGSQPSQPVSQMRGYPTDDYGPRSQPAGYGYSQNTYNQQSGYPVQQQQQAPMSWQVQNQLAQSESRNTQPPEQDNSAFNRKVLMDKQRFADTLDKLLSLEDKIGEIQKTSPSVNLKVQENYMNFLNRGIHSLVQERTQLQSGMNGNQIGWNNGLPDDARQRIALHNAMRVDKIEHELQHYTNERNKCAAEIQNLQTSLSQLKRLQDDRDELWQTLFNGDEYGSVTEYFHVERLNNLIAKYQVAALADYLWSTAQNFASLAKNQFEKVVASWSKIPQRMSNSGEVRELAVTARDDLAIALQYIRSLKLYLSDYNVPYFDDKLMGYLDEAYRNILFDAENPARQAPVGQFYAAVVNKALALHTWTTSTLKEKIKPDLRKVRQDILDDRIKLNEEKMRLLQQMIDESYEGDRKLREKLNSYKRVVDTQTQAETAAAARTESSTSTDQVTLTNEQVNNLLTRDAQAGTSVYTAPGAVAASTDTTTQSSTQATQAATTTSESGAQAASTSTSASVAAAPVVASVSTSASADTRSTEAGGVPVEVATLPSRDEIFSNIDKLWKQHDDGVNDLQQMTQASRAKANAELQAKLQARRQGAKPSTT